MPLWRLAFAKKGGLGWRDPWLWALLPLAYFLYGILRAGPEGKYPYPFMDVGALGWGQVVINGLVMEAEFIVVGFVLVGVDRAMGRRGVR